MPRFSFVDISADDPKRAIKFYQDVFGWKITKWEGPMDYWLIKTGEPSEVGVDGGLAKREDPSQFMTPVIDVPSVDDFATKVAASGGTIIHPKMTIPAITFNSFFEMPVIYARMSERTRSGATSLGSKYRRLSDIRTNRTAILLNGCKFPRKNLESSSISFFIR